MHNEHKGHALSSQDADKCGYSASETFVLHELFLSVSKMLLLRETELLGDRKKRRRGKYFIPHGDCILSLLLFSNLLVLLVIPLVSDCDNSVSALIMPVFLL